MKVQLPVVNLADFLQGEREKSLEECKKLAESLREYGAVVLRDPRVGEEDNNQFLDMMEDYFEQDLPAKMEDVRKDIHYQLGATPDMVECPRDHNERIEKNYIDMCRPLKPSGPDPKWRFFWRIGERPKETKFQELNAAPVIPRAFPQWPTVMNKWGELMKSSVTICAEMLALGLDLPEKQFSTMMNNAPHLLAPTGTELAKYGKLGTVLAGFHYDLNFLTIHGKSRYPALNIFLRDGSNAERKKVQVAVPDGCLLVQAGKQLEWLTGGYVQAGFHEVVVLEDTVKKMKDMEANNKSLWRVSSTLFGHIASDQLLEPVGKFKEQEGAANYPPTLAGEYVNQELSVLKLAA
jgi:isopenicillin N synthase-like dioxygenase